MHIVFDSYTAADVIPVQLYLKNKKLKKYFNRETEAAIVGIAKLNQIIKLPESTPFFFVLGQIEYEDYGLNVIVDGSRDLAGNFSNKGFVENGLPLISPLNQFKVLQNMPLSFASIEFNLRGENAVLYKTASSLLLHVLQASVDEDILIGATKAYYNGNVEAGFALVNKKEVENSIFIHYQGEAVNMFRSWIMKGVS